MTVSLGGEALVSAGKSVSIHAVIRNNRRAPVALARTGCGVRLALIVEVPFPLDPAGRSWPGIPGQLKDYVLSNHHSAGGVPEDGLLRLGADETSCAAPPEKGVLAAAAQTDAAATWKADYVPGLPLRPGDYQATATVFVAPEAEASAKTVNPTAYQPVDLRTTVSVTGSGIAPITAGQAIDNVLDEPSFTDWLAKEPSSSWTAANIFLRSQAEASGIVPPGALWEIDVFRGIDASREWAIVFVDAVTGVVLGTHYCGAPCES